MHDVHRALADSEEVGFVKIHVKESQQLVQACAERLGLHVIGVARKLALRHATLGEPAAGLRCPPSAGTQR